MLYGNTVATKNLIANRLWIIRTVKTIPTIFHKRNCLALKGWDRVGIIFRLKRRLIHG